MGGDANARAICSRAYKKYSFVTLLFFQDRRRAIGRVGVGKVCLYFIFLRRPPHLAFDSPCADFSSMGVDFPPPDISSGGTIGWVGGKEAVGVN
jgi:hypothetical protein